MKGRHAAVCVREGHAFSREFKLTGDRFARNCRRCGKREDFISLESAPWCSPHPFISGALEWMREGRE